MSWWGRALPMGLILVLATACVTPEDKALEDAQAACVYLGLPQNRGADNKPDETEWSTGRWKEAGDDLDATVKQAARAAQQDARWNSLSNEITKMQEWADQNAIATDPDSTAEQRAAAQAVLAGINGPESVRILKQECLKAVAK
ncbi:hypothetical protein ACFTXM_08520 [Streptomyces sp. NPDC056930]|uniref:hypothetical protein n=1 Tax=Streptomyces sp. NPDC056930 TaxID=3345967 RepID=UPI003631A260